LKKKLSKYISTRFATIIWDLLITSIDYLKTLPPFQPLFKETNFRYHVEKIFAYQLYSKYRINIQTEMQNIAITINTLLDPWSSMFYELTPLIMNFNHDFVKEWIEGNPNSSYTYALNKVIKKENAPVNEDIEFNSEDQKKSSISIF